MSQRDEKGRFPPGVSGNPGGYAKGKRNKLNAQCLDDMAEAWGRDGKAALARMAQEDPVAFVKAFVALIPKDMNVAVTDMTYDEAVRLLLNGGRAADGDAERAPDTVN